MTLPHTYKYMYYWGIVLVAVVVRQPFFWPRIEIN